MKEISELEIRKALTKSAWDLGNKVLYKLCADYPSHKTDQEIIAKIWLIGRSYAAAIERRKNKSSDFTGDRLYEGLVAPKIKNSEIDGWLALLKSEPTPKNVIETHYKLSALFCEISGHRNRSLSSKYLHFHRPDLFFIFDSRSATAIRQFTPSSSKQLEEFSLKKFRIQESDSAYAKFFCRCLWLQESLRKQHGLQLKPRDLDKTLLYFLDSRRSQ
jgi:hypothetical protein